MPFLSVVIPIYKVENYLKRCVDSVLAQQFADMEIILVDDGSPDQCPEICDAYAEQDNRIRVIHKPNGGLSSARNAGIEVATGEYIAFLDSDDAWAEGKLIGIIEVLKQQTPDMLMFMSVDVTRDGAIYERRDTAAFLNLQESHTFSREEYYAKLIESGNLHESACTKVLSLRFLKENNLTFQPGIVSEDAEWMFRVLRGAEKISVLNTVLFICTIDRKGSISNSANEKSLSDTLKIINQSVEYYKNHETDVKQYELAHCAYLLSIAIGIYGNMNSSVKKKYRSTITELSWLFKYNDSRKVQMVKRVYKPFGLDVCAFILHTYIKLNKTKMLGRKKIDG